MLREQEVARRFEALAFDPAFSAPDVFTRYLREEIVKWTRAIRAAGLK